MTDFVIVLLSLFAVYTLGSKAIDAYRNAVSGSTRAERISALTGLFERFLYKAASTTDQALHGAVRASQRVVETAHEVTGRVKEAYQWVNPQPVEFRATEDGAELRVFTHGSFLVITRDSEGMSALLTARNGKTKRISSPDELFGLLSYLSGSGKLTGEQEVAIQDFLRYYS